MAPNYVKCKRSIDPLERRRILGLEPMIIISNLFLDLTHTPKVILISCPYDRAVHFQAK